MEMEEILKMIGKMIIVHRISVKALEPFYKYTLLGSPEGTTKQYLQTHESAQSYLGYYFKVINVNEITAMQAKIICLIFIFWSLIYKHDIFRALEDGGGEEDFRVLEGTHRNSLLK